MENEVRNEAINKVIEAVKFVNTRLGVEVGKAGRIEYWGDTGAILNIDVLDDYDVFNLIDKLNYIVGESDDYHFEAYSALRIQVYVNVD